MQELFAPVGDNFSLDDALESWRWLVPRPVSFVAITALGDLFVLEGDGSVWFMDTIDAKYYQVASSVAQWQAMLQDPEHVNAWFMPQFVGDLRSAGVTLKSGECFSATIPAVLGGAFTPENWQPTSWRVHFWSPGQIHQQVKDLPPGTKITGIKYTPI
jgi:hypothetical protein